MIAKHAKQFDEQEHRLLAIWASDCAEHVLPYFEEAYPEDNRPRKAIEAARAWERGDLPMVDARKAAFASHAAARAAGHAAATAHIADHARHAAAYAIKAATASAITSNIATAESDWQYQHLPERLRSILFPTSKH